MNSSTAMGKMEGILKSGLIAKPSKGQNLEAAISQPILVRIQELFERAASQPAANRDRMKLRKKFMVLLGMHYQNFGQQMLLRRRRCCQRMRLRQTVLQTLFLQQLVDMEVSFLNLIPRRRIMQRTVGHKAPTKEVTGPPGESKPLAFSFYENVMKNFTDPQWLSRFRMSKQTYYWLCDQLNDALKPTSSNIPLNSISLEKRVAIALYALASGDDYRDIAILFDVSRVSVCNIVRRFADALLETLGACLIAMPKTAEEYTQIRTAFHRATNMPALVVGVVGQCRIPISPYAAEATTHINGQLAGSLTVETLIDERLLFRKVQVHDQHSTMFSQMPNEITMLPLQLINERYLPCIAVTPPTGYPLCTWLMHQYEDPVAPHEYDFNEAVDNLFTFNDKAHRRLFGRWKILPYKRDLDAHTMARIAIACCALHNLLEELNEHFEPDWAHGIDMAKFAATKQHFPSPIALPPSALESALEMRDFLARTISSTEM